VRNQKILQDIFQDFSVPVQQDADRENMMEKLLWSLAEVEGISGVSAPDAIKDAISAKKRF
jgi:hypothetical protein